MQINQNSNPTQTQYQGIYELGGKIGVIGLVSVFFYKAIKTSWNWFQGTNEEKQLTVNTCSPSNLLVKRISNIAQVFAKKVEKNCSRNEMHSMKIYMNVNAGDQNISQDCLILFDNPEVINLKEKNLETPYYDETVKVLNELFKNVKEKDFDVTIIQIHALTKMRNKQIHGFSVIEESKPNELIHNTRTLKELSDPDKFCKSFFTKINREWAPQFDKDGYFIQ